MACVVGSSTAKALGKAVHPASKLLGVGALNQIPSASIYSKTSGNVEPRLKPWDYQRLGFNYWYHLIDGTTKRFNYNSKMVVVDGPPAIGKTEFAKKLADELDMKFVPGFTMDDYYINSYGYDLRDFDYRLTYERAKSFDEKKFSIDPTSGNGGLDRMLWLSHQIRYADYMKALAHIFNTGEGIVTERSPFMDYIYVDAALEQGWIERSTKDHYYKVRAMMITELLRPNLIIHLNAPTDVVQSKIRKRAATTHPWEKNSPVWENTDYVEQLYQNKFKKYLKIASESSEVLSYDWSEGGDFEVVVEDIESLNLDYHDKYDKMQKDWRLLTEDGFGSKRYQYTQQATLLKGFVAPFFGAEQLYYTPDEALEIEKIKTLLPGNAKTHGFNTELGDPDSFIFGWFKLRQANYQRANHQHFHDSCVRDDQNYAKEMKIAANRKAIGDEKWWLN